MRDVMGPYLPLLRIDVAHGYFADGRCRGLRFVPVGRTGALINAADGIVRQDGSALALYGPPRCFQGLQAPGDAPPVLAWHVHATDDGFANYTADPALRPGELLVADLGDPEPAFDVRPLAWPLVAQTLDAASRRVPPFAVLRVPAAALSQPPVQHTLRVAARATVWKYCLHGDWAEPQLQVVDLAREAEFSEPAAERLDGGAPMLAIRSRHHIPLMQRSERRFQLRSRQRGGDKVLIKRLPVAGARQFAREEIDGIPTLISEIHVHR